MSKSTFQHLLSLSMNFFYQLFDHPDNPHLVARDHRHLEREYRRSFLAPNVVSQDLMQMISSDQHFRNALGSRTGVIVRVAIVGDYLHANCYSLERFPGGPLNPIYNLNWQADGIADYRISINSDEDAPLPEITPIVRHVRTDLSYDYYEPFASYFRPLTAAEIETLSATTSSRIFH